ncbi:Rieske 2Fe-2S domain-containing protein [Marinifilum caeruleilacunae]|uniref:(2Fe-2S)-binding protein n=1 Tax=Marinifilum caeruleilacunae TaxID=2499076 RepID=A0ABX1WZE0_9BACT|nr:Rieske 2Fe-2S domain-containing protein [Marinifilum caeruleilacunae]NOU61397.1 (2Fe-2S)-binding protein [Marinifilum caeruleilacunae]
MSHQYKAIHWNPQKKAYDLLIVLLIISYLLAFVGVSAIIHPNLDPVNLLIRAFGSLSLLLLHLVLIIGPLCRLSARFLPMLYNRRHLGVSTFLIAAFHGILSLIQFHAYGDSNMLISLFTANTQYTSLAQFPFQVLGFFALIILFFMAATSHDFWLKNLGQNFWKRLHMLIYLVYILVIMHVMLGVIQLESSPLLVIFLCIGFSLVIGLHLLAGWKEVKLDRQLQELKDDGYLLVGSINSWEEGKARIVNNGKQRIAIFKNGNEFSAISNRCAHQGGPLGEGQVIDGLITCPWHGYQYRTDDGCSPPPFTEKVSTFNLQLLGDKILVDPIPNQPGTKGEQVKL